MPWVIAGASNKLKYFMAAIIFKIRYALIFNRCDRRLGLIATIRVQGDNRILK